MIRRSLREWILKVCESKGVEGRKGDLRDEDTLNAMETHNSLGFDSKALAGTVVFPLLFLTAFRPGRNLRTAISAAPLAAT